MYVVTVVFEPKAEHAPAFRAAMLANAKASREAEPGCRQFDVCVEPDTDTAYLVTAGNLDLISTPFSGVASFMVPFNSGDALAAGDIDADGVAEVVTLEADYGDCSCRHARRIDVWKWDVFGFVLLHRSQEGSFRGLLLFDADNDGILDIIVR